MDQAGNNSIETACACAALRSAARAATQLYDLVLQPAGLKTTQFIALKTIEAAGEIAQWRFARENAIAIETLSRRFAALRRRGLISFRVGGPHGERLYSLTPEGKAALMRALSYWERAQKRFRQTLGDSAFGLLLQLCEKTVKAAHAAEELRASNFSSAAPAPECVPNGAVSTGKDQMSLSIGARSAP
jgi:DNA-binding MarR family transcriptional regulator